MNLLRNLTVWLVDLVTYPLGKAIDKTWDHFNFDDREDDQ